MKKNINQQKHILHQLGYSYTQRSNGKLSISKGGKKAGLVVFAMNKTFVDGKPVQNLKQHLLKRMP